jgi:UDP-N-acetylglucosamine 2-epimerase (non-hydrolysing)
VKKWKVTVIFGTRPEAIKLAPVILAMRNDPSFSCHVCVTAQHRQMLDQVLDVFGIVPDTDLDLMERDQSLGSFTSKAIRKLDAFIASARPDMILVQGDTTTVFCAALAAFYHRVPVGHVEAGLRTGSLEAPWPEEANRVLTTRLAALHFAPTTASRKNLLEEGVPRDRIHVTGNTVIDALFLALEKVRASPPPVPGLDRSIMDSIRKEPVVLITGHRRESFGKGLKSICTAIARLARSHRDVHFVYPVHMNPNVRKTVHHILGGTKRGNVHLIKPLPYLPFVRLMDRS